MDDPYETLGIERDATTEEVRAAYRRKAKAAHPDRAGGSSDDMAAANRAYDILSNPERRAAFDASGKDVPRTPIEIRAKELLRMAFMNVVNDLPEGWDSILATRERVKSGLVAGEAQIAGMRRRLHRLEKRSKRIRGGHLFADLIHAQMDGLATNIENMEVGIEVVKLALEILKSYSDADDGTEVSARMAGLN